MELAGRISSDAQVVLGMIELPEPDDRLAADIRALAGSLFPIGPASYVLVSTRGVLAQHTCDWTVMPLLEQLAQRHHWVRIGLGVGRSAADAEALARRAVERCRAAGPFTAIVSVGSGRDFVITETESDPGRAEEPVSLHVAAHRPGCPGRHWSNSRPPSPRIPAARSPPRISPPRWASNRVPRAGH